MTVKKLSHEQKDDIVRAYNLKTLKLFELAQFFGTSPRTIGRVLEERGLATPVPRLKSEAYQVMQLLKEHQLDLIGLKDRLSSVSMTAENVQLFLNQCHKEDLARFFYISGLAKLSEIAKQVNDHKQPETQTA